MIPFDVAYYRPSTIEEAVQLFSSLEAKGKRPLYYGGGTEFITLARLGRAFADAVIDLKSLPECRILSVTAHELTFGAAVSLTAIEEANSFPLLTKAAREVADRTARNQITLGGNICGRIFYHEAVLPFLLADSRVVIAGKEGINERSIHEVFQQYMHLSPSQFLVQVKVDAAYSNLPHAHTKRRQQGNTGYPLVTVAALKKDGKLRVAFSGVCPFPFRSLEIEERLNRTLPLDARIASVIEALPSPVLDDIEGSAKYRLFVLRHTLLDVITALEGES